MKKKLIAALFAFVAMATLAGCKSSGSTKEGSADQLAKIKEKGTIVIAMEGDWAPWSYHDTETYEVIGYDADTAKEIAKQLGVEVEIVEAPWESLFAGLDSGRYDLVVNGVEVTDERSEKYDFSEPYAYIHTALIVRSDNEEIQSFEDLAGKSTVNSLGSTYMDLAESYGATASGVSTLAETLTQVLQKRADATLNADVSFYDYMNQHADAELKIVATTEDASFVSIPMRKGVETESLRKAVNDAIATLRENGTLSELSNQYFGSDISSQK